MDDVDDGDDGVVGSTLANAGGSSPTKAHEAVSHKEQEAKVDRHVKAEPKPEKMIKKEADMSVPPDRCVAANGAQYTKNQLGMMPTLVNKMYNERVQYKKQMLTLKQKLVDIEAEMKKRGL